MGTALNFEKLRERIRLRRIELKMTQDALAEKCGLSKEHICNVETGKSKPSVQTLYSIAGALELTVNDLIYDYDNAAGSEFRLLIVELCAGCSQSEQKTLLSVLHTLKDHFPLLEHDYGAQK